MNYKHIKDLQQKLGIVGEDESLYGVLEMMETAAPTEISVLIHGESGTGKEVIANGLHKLSLRKHENFVAINCGALPENLIDSELFGYEKGAFTGAVAQKKGLFEIADKGTIFLDELGEMPLKTQVRLLRVLESGEIVRVGGTDAIRVNVRVVAATHKNLEESILSNEFRRDLYYRLKAITIPLPSLRERKADIPILIDFFIKKFILENHVVYGGIEDDARQMLMSYHWPGNIRELKNTMETLLVLSKGEPIKSLLIRQQLNVFRPEMETNAPFKSMPVHLNKSSEQVERELIYQTLLGMRLDIQELKTMVAQISGQPIQPMPHNNLPLGLNPPSETVEHFPIEHLDESNRIENLSMDDMERDMIRRALDKFSGNRRKAATALNISERTLYRKIKEYDIQ
jgi:transcriptional regulator with PAS, ATPase and Fis domain